MVGYNLNSLGIDKIFDLSNNNTSYLEEYLPIELYDGSIVEQSKKIRCKLEFNNKIIYGGYGILHEAIRNDEHGSYKCIIKYAKPTMNSVLTEALLQYISYNTLKRYNIHYMVSKVYDLYKRKDNTIFFSMQKINGINILDFLKESLQPEKDFIDCMIQVSILLYILKNDIYLDHRDLRYTNLFIVNKPTNIHFTYDKEYIIDTKFHICLLDFGLACIGPNNTTLNAGDLYNSNEKCLKPGRDIFQIVSSLMCLKEFRDKLNPSFMKIVESWFQYKNTDYSKIAKSSCHWTYILTSENDFHYDFFVPENFLSYLYDLQFVGLRKNFE